MKLRIQASSDNSKRRSMDILGISRSICGVSRCAVYRQKSVEFMLGCTTEVLSPIYNDISMGKKVALRAKLENDHIAAKKLLASFRADIVGEASIAPGDTSEQQAIVEASTASVDSSVV